MIRTPRGSDTEEQTDPAEIPVVGIGASAGGITALHALLPHLPAGIAYVVVQHLDPSQPSMLPRLLERVSKLAVREAAEGLPVEPDHIYVGPSHAQVTIEDGRLQLRPPPASITQRTPIDEMLQSLAVAGGEMAAGVILSGTGSDGTRGLRTIKQEGGLTIAQQGAEYDGMMRSAVRTGVVDFVLPLEGIPGKLVDYFQHLRTIGPSKGPDGVREEAVQHQAQIMTLLRVRTGHDFSGYKERTVTRRIQRRMQVLQIEDLPDFIERLRRQPEQLDLLLQDLLIGVTNFFRDPAAFEALEREVVPKLFEGKGADDSVRVWVAGCSTGEEAYSLAILLREHAGTIANPPRLQLFASDIDEHSLQAAREGRYAPAIARDLSPKRLERHFVREEGNLRVSSELREICLFSAHNVLRDAPFSKLDLISCRNLLIYLKPDLQDRLIPLFHYALNDPGFLFLGSSENVTRHSRLFSPVDKTHRLFRRRVQADRRMPEFPLIMTDSPRRTGPVGRPAPDRQSLQVLAERQLLDRYSPAYVVIDADGDVLQSSARTGKYLELAAGVPRIDIFSMARQGLRADLRAAVHKAATGSQSVTQRNVVVGTSDGRQAIDLTVQPLRVGSADPLFLVVFKDVGDARPPETEEAGGDGVQHANFHQIEVELRAVRERLQITTEELETSNEELKSGNEELSSMNEELQSANEELETSKEELQSINEELQTVNSELNARVEELSRANSDIANLLESTQIATLFLDRNLAVKSFTPAAKDLFRLVESDSGRPITHVRSRFDSDAIQEEAERVLRTLSTIEREVQSDRDARYIMRMMPYRTVENVIAGVVITFVDVTRITAAEAKISELTRALRERIQSLETLLDLLPVGVMIVEDSRNDQIRINRHGMRLLGESSEGFEPRLATQLRLFQGEQEIAFPQQPLQRAVAEGKVVTTFEGQLQRVDGTRTDVFMAATPLFDDSRQVRGGIVAIVDISERKRAEAHQQTLLYELQHRVKNILATVSALAVRMLRSHTSLEEFSSAYLGRLQAMALTHELLSRGNWTGADLSELLAASLRAQSPAPDAVRLAGPALVLPPNMAATLGLAFYEMGTNATKYGALSSIGGRIDVTWRVENGRLVLDWQEHDGPAPPSPLKPGFGLTYIKRSIEYELDGSATVATAPSGLHWKLDLPIAGK